MNNNPDRRDQPTDRAFSNAETLLSFALEQIAQDVARAEAPVGDMGFDAEDPIILPDMPDHEREDMFADPSQAALLAIPGFRDKIENAF
ncbi:hypothetical protein KJ742_07695 [Patescibacteria group bacterium]|nr:hypothetical protein [Patescibacteria group bacterium]MBU1683794.1 hypothetical protein [Patescibacteria group bacterium]MBU1935599.1 hypothetical protein [Patescibacteria group bacterium]